MRAAGQLPVRVKAQGFVDDPGIFKDIYGTYVWQFGFPNNTLCNSTVSFSAYVDRRHVGKGNGFFELAPAFSANAKMSLRTWDNSKALPVVEFQQATQMDAFARNILDDTPVVASGAEGMIDMQIIGAIKAFIESGQEVEISYA
jgi:glucose-fructose oxidoreductase